MANLDEMLEFAKHWDAYRSEERQLDRLKTCPPVVLADVDEMERRRTMFMRPEHAAYDYQTLVELGGAVEPVGEDDGSQAPWGWWLREEGWEAYCGLIPLLGALDQASKHLDDVLIQQRGALDADVERARAAERVVSYRHANETDRETLADLEDRRDAIQQSLPKDRAALKRRKTLLIAAAACFAAAVAVGIAWSLAPADLFARLGVAELAILVIAALLALLALRPIEGVLPLRVRRIREDLERANIRIKDTRDRIERREKEIEKLSSTIKERESALMKPFEKPLDDARRAIEAAERAVLAQYEADLSDRDDAFDASLLEGLSFDDAVALANQREWALLEQWMDRYKQMLPLELEHAQNVAESELVWLEGHAPFGKRYWPLTDDVLAFMRSGRTDQSDVALRRVMTAVDGEGADVPEREGAAPRAQAPLADAEASQPRLALDADQRDA